MVLNAKVRGGAGMTHFDNTLQVIAGIHNSVSLEQICHRLLDFSGSFGLRAVMAGVVPGKSTKYQPSDSAVLFAKWPPEWFRRYVSRGYVTEDPIVLQAGSAFSPFTWADAAQRFSGNGVADRVIGDATAFGLFDGFASPLATLDGSIVLVSLGGDRFVASPAEQSVLSLVVAYAIGRAIQLKEQVVPAVLPQLTPREAECLRWAAIGKSEWEISCILGISEHTAERHLMNAKARLGATNRVQAVAEAIRLGLIG